MQKFNFLMFIDDDYATNYYHEIIAEDSNLVQEMKFFQSASKALEFFASPMKLPEVIFLDVNMPEVNGWEFLDKFKDLDMQDRPKIVMMSTSINPHDKERSEQNELISEFINKPLTEEYLKTLLAQVAN